MAKDFDSAVQDLLCVRCGAVILTFDRTKAEEKPSVAVLTGSMRCAACESKITKLLHVCGKCKAVIGVEEVDAEKEEPAKDVRDQARCGKCAREDANAKR